MNPTLSPVPDRRGRLFGLDYMQRWFELPSGFTVGLRYEGEFRMGADTGQVIIADRGGREWMNFGNYRFYFPSWNAGGVRPDGWNNPIAFSPDGNYVAFNWLYAHRHSTMSSVLIHLPSRTYLLVEPRRILTVTGVAVGSEGPELMCSELVWNNSRREDRTDVRVVPSEPLRPIAEFFELDPFTVETDVYSWKEGVLQVEPLRNFRNVNPSTEKEREEIKRARMYSPVARWQHIKEITDWVSNQFRP
jgi:hypothetical protein